MGRVDGGARPDCTSSDGTHPDGTHPDGTSPDGTNLDGTNIRGAMPASIRREGIIATLAEHGFVRVVELGAEFGVSAVTVRADLDALVSEGVARRVHGGAIAARAGSAERSFEQSLEHSAQAKHEIGALAAGMVSSGHSVLLDVGTTTLAVARALRDRVDLQGVTIITNGLSIALELEPCIPRYTVIVTGGSLRPLQHSLVEPLALSVLERVHADIAFIGCNGIDVEYGVSNINLPEASIKEQMMRVADRSVVVAESAKLGQRHLGRIASLAAVDTIITDGGVNAAWLESVPTGGPNVLIAGAES